MSDRSPRQRRPPAAPPGAAARAQEAASAASVFPQHAGSFGRLGPSRPAPPPVLGLTRAGRALGRRSAHDDILALLFPLLGLFPLTALVLIALRGCS